MELRLSIEVPSLSQARMILRRETFPLLEQAVRAVATQTAANWIEAVQRAKLWSGEKDAYASSIQWKMTGDFEAEVWTDYKHAQDIETGRPPRDLKAMLNTSTKVRRTKDGTRFLVIPFRHSTPGNSAHGNDMPQHVYNQARMLAPSRIVGQGQRRAGELTGFAMGFGMVPYSEKRQRRSPYLKSTGTRADVMVTKNVYSWGGRLVAGSMGPNPKGRTDRFAGMYRFDSTTPGGKRSSVYMTFRIMSEKSSGWIVPAQPGQNIARQVIDAMRPLAEKAFGEAVRRSL